MPLIKINGKDYEFDQLSEKAKDQLNKLRFVDSELKRLKSQAAALQIAHVAYGNALLGALAEIPLLNENKTLN